MSIYNKYSDIIEESDFELLDIDLSPVNDIVVPISIAAKMKHISTKSIHNAINNGKLKRVNGVTLESLKGYEVDKARKNNGNIGTIKRLKKKIKKLENKEESEVLEEELEEDA